MQFQLQFFPEYWLYIPENNIIVLFSYNYLKIEIKTEVRNSGVTKPSHEPVYPYHVHNQADFDNPFIIGRGFIYLGISKMSFTFTYLQEFKVGYQ